mmetsp:Transcript_16435/g.40444  ORF Transcript_16435/g.40444 Transcript_16435/m.40444 type:complete len:515 (-) Transcript_16435:131-1675(-)
MGCGASTQSAIKESAPTTYERAVSQGKYYAVGCFFDPDANAQQKSLVALEKGLRAASLAHEKWAKNFKPMSGSLITHWADTTEMPLASKDALIATAASIAGSSRAHRAYAEAVVQEYCVKGLQAAAAAIKPALDAYHVYEEAEYTLVYERKMQKKKLEATEGREAELEAAARVALDAAKKLLTEVLDAIENDVLVPTLRRSAELAAEYCAAVAGAIYPPDEGEKIKRDSSDSVQDEEGASAEGTEADVAATLKHAESDEYQAMRFKGLGTKDAMEMARKRYADMKVYYKNVVLPAEFKQTEKMLSAHKTHMYAITYKATMYGKSSVSTIFAPERDVLRETLSKMAGFHKLKQAVTALAAKVAAAGGHSPLLLASIDSTGATLSELVEVNIKDVQDAALVYTRAVSQWKVCKDRLGVLTEEAATLKEAGKSMSDKRHGEKTRLAEEFPQLEATSTEQCAAFYALAAALYENEGCAVAAVGVPAVQALSQAHVTFFTAAGESFASDPQALNPENPS